jgi:hypothetical protein
MFDPAAFELGGISLIAVVFGLTELLKSWLNWEGKKVTALAASLGVIFMAVFQVTQFLPPEYVPVVNAVIASIAFGLAASGFYKFGTRNE